MSLLRMLGIDPRMLEEQVVRREAQSQYYTDLTDSYQQMQRSLQLAQFAQLLQSGGIPGQGDMPAPMMSSCHCPGMYAAPPMMFGDAGGAMSMDSLMQGGNAAVMQQFLMADPFARQQLEMMLGGRLMPGDMSTLNVMPFPMGGQTNPFMQGYMAGSQNAFQQMMLGALMQAMFGPPPKKAKKKKHHANGHGHAHRAHHRGHRRGHVDAAQHGRGGGGGGGGGGVGGMFQGGSPGPHQGAFGISGSGGDDVAGVLNDPTLTVEDKVTLMIMLIMKKMDKDIERQAQHINSLQQQQNGGGGGGGGAGGTGGPGGGGAPSIDVETMKLKRLIDKRGQMFDMLRQIIDKYNQTAKGIIDSIGR